MPSLLASHQTKDDILTAWKGGDWQSCLPNAALQSAQENPTLGNVYLALQIKNAIDGIATDDLATFIGLLRQSSQHAGWSKAALRLLCGKLPLENTDSAHVFVSRFLTGRCKLTSARTLNRFPLALRFLNQHYPKKLRLFNQNYASLAVQLGQRVARFDEKLVGGLRLQKLLSNERKHTVAIVGNGPSLLDKAYGQIIDDHDAVIRFNKPVLSDEYLRYSGRRTDLLVVSPDQAKKTPQQPINALAISGINILQGESGYWPYLARLTPSLKVAVFDQVYWYQLVKELKAPPSAGLLTIASLANQVDLEINLFGFTSSVADVSKPGNTHNKPSAVSDGAHYGDQQVASNRHNWKAEAELVTHLVDSTPYLTLHSG